MRSIIRALILNTLIIVSVSCIDKDELAGGKSPIITSVIPDEGRPRDTITIVGSNFQDISIDSVFINGELSQLSSLIEEQIIFIVPDSATTGPIIVKNDLGTGIGSDFRVLPPILIPQIKIDSINPKSAFRGDSILIYGQNFTILPDTYKVHIDTTELASTIQSNSIIKAIISQYASTGTVYITNNQDTIWGPILTVLDDPIISISSITPNQDTVGAQVTISGQNFDLLSPTFSLFFNGTEASTTIISAQELSSTVPPLATTGLITIYNEGDSIKGPNFTVIDNTPQITAISPTAGPEGTLVTITGNNFGADINDVEVKLNGDIVSANSITDTEIQFNVPPNSTTGAISVTILSILKTATGPVFTVEAPLINVLTMAGTNNGTGSPFRIISDGNGNFLFTDTQNHQIKRITPAGVVTVFAGTGQAGFLDGKTGNAQFNFPIGLARDSQGNIYVADENNHVIRMINTSNVVSTIAGNGVSGFADGLGLQQAQFNQPFGLAINNNILYIADNSNHAIRELNLQTSNVTTVAGNGLSGFVDGKGTTSRLNRPLGIAIDLSGNLLIADAANHSIRYFDVVSGNLSTVTGVLGDGFVDGTTAEAKFSFPYDLSVNSTGEIYVADGNNHSIRLIENGITSTLIGNGIAGFQDGDPSQAQFNFPTGIFILNDGELWICDFNNAAIRKIEIN